MIEAAQHGMGEFEVSSVIEKLKRDGLLYEPQPGYLQKY